MRDKVVGRIPVFSDHQLRRAHQNGQRVDLQIADSKGAPVDLQADHIISATGYRVSLPRLDFLDPELLTNIAIEIGSPVLSANFESSIPGLYFVGLAAAATFGPLLRFALGARFSARQVAGRLRRTGSTYDKAPATSKIASASQSPRQVGG
jgi:hypothetical protein